MNIIMKIEKDLLLMKHNRPLLDTGKERIDMSSYYISLYSSF